jgi:hypothetical protein
MNVIRSSIGLRQVFGIAVFDHIVRPIGPMRMHPMEIALIEGPPPVCSY